MTNKLAHDGYMQAMKEALRLSVELVDLLANHAHKFVDSGKTDWGYVGDLEEVSRLLRQAVNFLAGKDD